MGAVQAASSTIVSLMEGFNIIPTTYLQVEGGEWQRGVKCRYCPVISRSPILARGPYTPNYLNFLAISTVQRVEFDPWTGQMWFLDWNNSMGIREASDWGNAIIWSYTAGFEQATEALKQVTVKTIGMSNVPTEAESFSGASFSMKFRRPTDAMPVIMNMLRQFVV